METVTRHVIKIVLAITGAGVVARKQTVSNEISELLDGAKLVLLHGFSVNIGTILSEPQSYELILSFVFLSVSRSVYVGWSLFIYLIS